jgi:hypothetical protein
MLDLTSLNATGNGKQAPNDDLRQSLFSTPLASDAVPAATLKLGAEMIHVPHKGWIGVDLDGTLARYDRWRGVQHIGEPVPAILDEVRKWLAIGHEVRIFTARVWKPAHIRWDWRTETAPPLEVLQKMVDEHRLLTPVEDPGFAHRDQGRYLESFLALRYIEVWCQKHLNRVLAVTCEKDPFMAVLWDDRCVQVEANTGRIAVLPPAGQRLYRSGLDVS